MNEEHRNGLGGMADNDHNLYSLEQGGWYRVHFDSGKFIGRFLAYSRKGIVSFDRLVDTSEVTGQGMVCGRLERLSTIVHSSITGIQQMTEEDVEGVVKEANFPLAYLGREVSVNEEYGVLYWAGDEFVVLRPHIARRITRGIWRLCLSEENNYVPYARQGSIIEPLPKGTLRDMVRMHSRSVLNTSANGELQSARSRRAAAITSKKSL